MVIPKELRLSGHFFPLCTARGRPLTTGSWTEDPVFPLKDTNLFMSDSSTGGVSGNPLCEHGKLRLTIFVSERTDRVFPVSVSWSLSLNV